MVEVWPKRSSRIFEQILGIGRSEGVAHPVVEDEQVDPCQGAQEGGIRGILLGPGRGNAAGGRCGNSARNNPCGSQQFPANKPGNFFHLRWARDQDIQMIADPGALAQLEHLAPVQAALGERSRSSRAACMGKAPQVQGPANAVVAAPGAFLSPPAEPGVLRRRARYIWGCLAARAALPGRQAGASEQLVE